MKTVCMWSRVHLYIISNWIYKLIKNGPKVHGFLSFLFLFILFFQFWFYLVIYFHHWSEHSAKSVTELFDKIVSSFFLFGGGVAATLISMFNKLFMCYLITHTLKSYITRSSFFSLERVAEMVYWIWYRGKCNSCCPIWLEAVGINAWRARPILSQAKVCILLSASFIFISNNFLIVLLF